MIFPGHIAVVMTVIGAVGVHGGAPVLPQLNSTLNCFYVFLPLHMTDQLQFESGLADS